MASRVPHIVALTAALLQNACVDLPEMVAPPPEDPQSAADDPVAPIVTVTEPVTGALLSGTTNLTAVASDDIGVAGVQFLVDGAPFGDELTSPPYTLALDTSALDNGSHSVQARARDTFDNVTTSATVTFTVANEACATASVAADAWQNVPFPPQSGSFTAEWNVTPQDTTVDGAIALASGAQTDWSGLAAIIRFNSEGSIDVRDGDTYTALKTLSYTANAAYHVRAEVDVASHTYSVFVQAPGGNEELLALDAAFRTAQQQVSVLDTRTVGTDAGALTVCEFDLMPAGSTTAGGSDTTAPTVSISAPAPGATLSGVFSVSATASDDVGVVGVQFTLDGAAVGAEDTSAPFALTLNASTLPTGSHSFSAVARDAAGNTAAATAVSVTITATTASTGYPRIFLDPSTLDSLRQRATSGDSTWLRLRNACNSFLGGTVSYPDGNDYPDVPNIGEGYQGSDYIDPLLEVGLCYQIGLGIGDANTDQWGAKGADVLEKMSNPSHSPAFGRDDGYGIRFFGVGMALGYDWLHDAMTDGLRAQVYNQLNAWFAWWDENGFEHDHPQGNYFAGYYAAKAYAGLATEGENPNGSTLWSDFYNRLHRGGPGSLGTHTGVQAYYDRFMKGGGWTEGWGYGALAVSNMDLPSVAALTAKGLDLIGDASAPYTYPLDNGTYFIELTWPSGTYLDDRDCLHEGNSGSSYPARPNPTAVTVTSYMLERWNDPTAAQFHTYARAVRDVDGLPAPWADFLLWDDAAAEADFRTLPKSYLAKGMNTAAMRSDWGTDAVWASFRASAYVDYGGSGEQYYDAGGLAIVRGATPFLVNATGALVTSYPGANQTFENDIDTENYAGDNPRRIYNVFYNGTRGQKYTPADGDGGTPASTRVSRFEDGDSYVYTRGEGLEETYRETSVVNSWTRDIMYLRPHLFVVFDRTEVGDTSGDQHMNWHLLFTPQSVTAPSAGANRYDVTNPSFGFLGAVTTLLPANAKTSLVNVFNSNKVYRLEVRPATGATGLQWLTIFDAASSANDIAKASVLDSSSNVKGALLTTSQGNFAALFGAGDKATVTTAPITFTLPTAATRVVIADLSPNGPYSVSTSLAGNTLSVTVTASGARRASGAGVLSLALTAAGGVQ